MQNFVEKVESTHSVIRACVGQMYKLEEGMLRFGGKLMVTF